jgi:hypothetical protein
LFNFTIFHKNSLPQLYSFLGRYEASFYAPSSLKGKSENFNRVWSSNLAITFIMRVLYETELEKPPTMAHRGEVITNGLPIFTKASHENLAIR